MENEISGKHNDCRETELQENACNDAKNGGD